MPEPDVSAFYDDDGNPINPMKRFLRTAGVEVPRPATMEMRTGEKTNVTPLPQPVDAPSGATALSDAPPAPRSYHRDSSGLMVPDTGAVAVSSRPVTLETGAPPMGGPSTRTGITTTVAPSDSGDSSYVPSGAGLMIPRPKPVDNPTMGGGDFSRSTPISPAETTPASTSSFRPGIGARLSRLNAPAESDGELADQEHLRQVEQPLDRNDQKYHLGVMGRIWRAAADFGLGGVRGVIEGAVDPNSRLSFGKGAKNLKYYADSDARQRDIDSTKSRIATYDDENKHRQSSFQDEYRLAKDQDLEDLREENLELRSRRYDEQNRHNQEMEDQGQQRIDNKKDFDNAKAAAPYKTLDAALSASVLDPDPEKRAAARKAADAMLAARKSIHQRAAAKAPDYDGLTSDENRLLKNRLAPLNDELRVIQRQYFPGMKPEQKSALDKRAQELRGQMKSMVDDAQTTHQQNHPQGAPKSSPGSKTQSEYGPEMTDGKDQIRYNRTLKRWEFVKSGLPYKR